MKMENQKITKKIEEERISVIKFTDEEIEHLNIKENRKYAVEEKDGSIVLTPYAEVEIDFESFDKSLLLYLIKKSLDEDISMNEVIEQILMEACEYWEDEYKICKCK
jgi:hypothetical protein